MFNQKYLVVFLMIFGSLGGGVGLAVGELLVDPMQPPKHMQKLNKQTRPQIDTRDWHLQAIFWGADRQQVIINGVTLTQGMSFRGARVTQIDPLQVQLQATSGRKITLYLAQNLIKTFHSGTK